MKAESVHQQLHGYRKGHQLLSTSLALDVRDQDVVDRLSDLTGRLSPGEVFEPYLTTYPLPSRTHYVVARTFQDLDAPRSGCVLTRSVLIPMRAWVELKTLDWVLAALVAVERGEEAGALDVPDSTGVAAVPEVDDARVEDIVQALFLEDARPVVVFDAPDAELIAHRLLLALWPALRQRFSICTLALGRRRVYERDFDLAFAPIGARSRFPPDAFRRVGARASESAGELHRWAGPTASYIFRAKQPSLGTKDPLGLLEADDGGDRTAVRVVLLWHELASRAATSPSAVLGMLDILNGSDGQVAKAWPGLLDTVVGATELAGTLSPQDSWVFLLALDGKLTWETAPVRLAEKVEVTAQTVAHADVEEAIRVLTTRWAAADRSEALERGLANGLAMSAGFGGLFRRLDALEPHRLLRLTDLSDRLKKAMAKALGHNPEAWCGTIERVLRGNDPDARRRVRESIVCAVDVGIGSRWISRLLAGAEGSELAVLAVGAGHAGRLGANGLTDALVEAARGKGGVKTVRQAVVDRVPEEAADGFLVRLLRFLKGDVTWLLGAVERGRAGRILKALLGEADDAAIRSVMSDERLADSVLTALYAGLPSSAQELARVLVLDIIGVDAALDWAFEVAERLDREERRAIERWIVEKALSEAGPGDVRVGRAVEAYGTALSAEELVAAATAAGVSWRRVGANLVVLNAASAKIRDGVVGVTDLLSRQLVQRPPENLGASAYDAWARLISDVDDERAEVRVSAAGTALGFALGKVWYPVSELVVASFPAVYAEVAQLKALSKAESDLRALSSFFRLSWKKPKEGRQEMIDALVGAYMRSSWPPADLMLAALRAGIEDRVVKRVRERLSGGAYLEKVNRDARRLDQDLSHRVRNCVAGRM